MITTLVPIGNLYEIGIPTPLTIKSGLQNKVALQVKRGEIRITAIPKKNISVSDTVSLSEKILTTDWNRPEEDKAWASLQ